MPPERGEEDPEKIALKESDDLKQADTVEEQPLNWQINFTTVSVDSNDGIVL